MNEWLRISRAPKDGTVVRLRRVYKGRLIAEGDGYFGNVTIYYPGGPFVSVNGLEHADDSEETYRGVWVKSDGKHLFPTPTHFMTASGTPDQ